MKLNKRTLKLAMIANYVNTHPGTTRSSLKNFLIEKGISKPYSNNLVAEARLLGIIAQENELMRMNDQSVLVLGENAGKYIKAYSDNLMKQTDVNIAGLNVHLQGMTQGELKALMEEAAKALKAKDGMMTW